MHKNINLLEIHEVTMNALFIIPVLVPFYRDEIGLDFQDFLFCEAIFAFTVCALEIPSGWISDIWNRKYVLMLSNLFIILGFTALMFANNLPTAIISQIIIGISVSLMSGTNSALLYDTLIASKNEKYFARFEGRRRGFGLYSIAAASFVGGFLYEINRELPIILSICTISIGLIATIFIVEPPRKKKAIQHHPVADMLSTIRYTLVGNTAIGGIIVFSAALFCSTKLIMWMQ